MSEQTQQAYSAADLTLALEAIRDSVRVAQGKVPPPEVQLLAAQVAVYCDAAPAELIVRDREWGDVRSPGAWSIAYEGGPDRWSVSFVPRALAAGTVPDGWLLEPVNGVTLGVYPE